MDIADLERRAQQIVLSGLDLDATCLAFDELLRRAVPYAVAAWSTHDPATGLFTSCTMSGLPKDVEREVALFRHEFSEGEPNAFRTLIAEGRTVALLHADTEGELERAARYRELLSAFGVVDELRAVLWADERPWGSATLYRLDRRFTEDDGAAVGALAPHAAHGLRLVLLRAAASRPEAVDEPPGVLKVGVDGDVTAVTAPAEHWLETGGEALVTATNSVAAAVRSNPSWEGAASRLILPGSRLLRLHASRATGPDGEVVVIVDSARPAEVSSMLVDAYGLTPRQRDVLGLLLLGRSMTQIAGALRISEHTVNDHRKAIYARVGVASRSELAALLQSEHYDPRSHAGVTPSPYGGFLDPRP